MGEKKRTHAIFGEFIDSYTLKASEADGSTVPILYEGRTAEGAVKEGADLDELFEDLFADASSERLEAIKRKYATKGQIFEAPALIADKARDMLRHYVANVMPSGLKAQVVAYSRLAALRYYAAFLAARSELLSEAEELSPREREMDDEELCSKPALLKARVMAWRQRELLAVIEFAPVISGGNNDPPEWMTWSEAAAQEARIERFKKPLRHAKADKADPLAFLIVKSMLLTGLDAPVEGVLYLDRPIREAELLQAVARVNRTERGKRFGLVVDYYGLARHLKEALAAYDAEDIDGCLASVKDQVPVLADRHYRVVDIFNRRGVLDIEDSEECVELLEDERLFAEFTVKLKSFLDALDFILPRPEALPYAKDAKALAYIYARARNRYKQGPSIGKDTGAKVRKLIDDHVVSLGVDPTIPPISLADADFEKKIRREAGDRAKASEMEHAIKARIRESFAEDPVLYRKLSERLDRILERLGENWKELVQELWPMIEEMKSGASAADPEASGLPELCAPFHRTVLASFGDAPSDLAAVKGLSLALFERIAAEARGNPDLWRPNRIPDQLSLKGELFEILNDTGMIPAEKVEQLLDALISQARANHERLQKS